MTRADSGPNTGDDAPGDLLARTVAAVRPADPDAVAAARERQARLTKPQGALGVLEDVSIRIAGLTGECPPSRPDPAAVAVFAADHGVHARGVSPWPQEVTAQMIANMLGGGAAVNVFARSAGADVLAVDVGVATPLPPVPDEARIAAAADLRPGAGPRLLSRPVRPGTADLSTGPAMSRAEAVAALETGIEVAAGLVAAGYRCLLTGDMGIANTTASAALVAAFAGADPARATGRGTGVDDATLDRKVRVVAEALERHGAAVAAAAEEPVAVLAALGGLEHAAIAGFLLGAAAHRVPVILDGVIAGSAALVAAAVAPPATDAWVAGHRSAEPGHGVALGKLGLTPLVDLELRLGEGTGAVLALPTVRAAVAALAEMATFDSAGVTGKDG